MEKEIETEQKLFLLLKDQGADFIFVVDISSQIRPIEFPVAVIIGAALPKRYLHELYTGEDESHDGFVEKEMLTDHLAEVAEGFLIEQGYGAYAQSENRNKQMGFYDDDKKQTVLPHKTIAVLGGIGWIGKSDLLITHKYGSGFSMCTVLTDAPLKITHKKQIPPQCGDCNICVNACPPNIIHNCLWKLGRPRDEIIAVKDCICCLKCMSHCPWTRKYAEQKDL